MELGENIKEITNLFNTNPSKLGRNVITSVRIKAAKAQVTLDAAAFSWKENSNCALWTCDIKDNPCIDWVNG